MYGIDSPTSSEAATLAEDPPLSPRALEIRAMWDEVEEKAKAFARDFCMLENGDIVARKHLPPDHPLRRADTPPFPIRAPQERPSFLVRLFRRFF